MIYHPQSNRPMVNFQVSCDLAQVHTIHIHFRCSFVQTLWITLVFRFGRVLPPTLHAPIALRSSIGFACLVLATCLITIGTLFHASILAHPFSHSRIGMPKEYPTKLVNVLSSYFQGKPQVKKAY